MDGAVSLVQENVEGDDFDYRKMLEEELIKKYIKEYWILDAPREKSEIGRLLVLL